MKGYVLISLFLLSTSTLFASQLSRMADVSMNIKEPIGYSNSIEFDVNLSIGENLIAPYYQNADIEMKIFLPPALTLISGPKNWKGALASSLNETFSFKVVPTLKENLIYDIAAVIVSDSWDRPLIITKSFYLEKNRGIIFQDSIIPQLLKNPWLMEAIGASVTNIPDLNGKKRKAMSINVDKLQLSVDDEIKWQEARPNRLHDEEYLQYLRGNVSNQKSVASVKNKKKKGHSIPVSKLSVSTAWCLGAIRNTVEYLCDIKVVAFTIDGQDTIALGEGYTYSYGGIGEYEFEIDEDLIVDDFIGIIAYTENSNGEPVQDWASPNYTTYSLVDTTYTYYAGGPTYSFGTARFNDISTQYNNAAQVHQHLFETRMKTLNDGGYDCPELYRVRFPDDTYPGYSSYGNYQINICSDHWNYHGILAHEFGHHLDRVKTGSVGAAGSWDNCSVKADEVVAFGEPWAQAFAHWAIDYLLPDDYGAYCGYTGPKVPVRLTDAIIDLFDDRDDGEGCVISMSNILQYGLVTGTDSIRALFNKLITQFPGDSTDINAVKELNEITDGSWLLASVHDNMSYPSASLKTSLLLQNAPNPFNPYTTISYEVGGNVPVFVSLKIYDIRGREIAALVSGERVPGIHNVYWNGENQSGGKMPSGVYLYRLKVDGYSVARKMVLLK